GLRAGHRLQRSAARSTTSGLISRDLFSAARFTSSRTCEMMLTRAVFSEGDAARPITASQPPGAHARLASITGQGGKAALTPPQVCAAKPRGLQAPPATAAGV